MNTLGRLFRVSLLGESHGPLVGVLVDGVPAGVPFSEADVQPDLDRRRPGQSLLTTQRSEADRVEIQSGVHNGRTTGAPVLMVIRNTNTRSQDYEATRTVPRPGHSDYPARVRFGGWNDPRGGGMFSGRLTACHVMAGALAKAVLRESGIQIAAHATRIGTVATPRTLTVAEIREHVERTPVRCADLEAAKGMEDEILKARGAKDSVGGTVECIVENVPTGLGEPNADSVESLLAHAVFSIPATKGIEFGAGFRFAEARGSAVSDPYYRDPEGRVLTRSNHNGGVLGGITSGMPLVFRVAFKPTSSISVPQPTLDLASGDLVDLEVKGRHDPCIVPRAVPVVEAMAALVLADLLLLHRALAPREVNSEW